MFFTARACCLLRASCCRLATTQVAAAAASTAAAAPTTVPPAATSSPPVRDAASLAKRRGRRRRRRRLSRDDAAAQPGTTSSEAQGPQRTPAPAPSSSASHLITPPPPPAAAPLVEDVAVAQALEEVERSLRDMPQRATTTTTAAAAAAATSSASKEDILAHAIASAQRLNARALQLEEQTRPSYSAAERIERRRSKFAVAETEFDVGITERLFPELRRLPALHELHYGDAVVREVDRATYFAARAGTSSKDVSREAEAAKSEAGLSDEAFAAFDAESAPATATASTGSAEGDEGATKETGAGVAEEQEKKEDNSTRQETAMAVAAGASETMRVPSGQERPWFVPDGNDGAVRLRPLSGQDCLCLLQFVLRLRGQGVQDLSPRLQRKVIAAQHDSANNDAAVIDDSQKDEERETATQTSTNNVVVMQETAQPLCFEDVMTYLDTAPAPVEAFTADLHPRDALRSPAFVFVLYVENVSVQNAIGHLAALFSLPQRAFLTHTAASKMSCSTLLCALEANRLRREHLLLVNTMRHPGFVLRISDIRAVPEDYGRRRARERRAESSAGDEAQAAARPVATASMQLFTDLALWQPLYESEVLLRRVSCGGRAELERRLRAMRALGAVFFCSNREASLARAATDVLHGHYRSALINALYRRKAPLAMRQFLLRPNVVTAAKARQASTDATVRQVLKTFIASDGSWATTVHRTPYVWRRRWLNALRATVWNAMASRRLRGGGRRVLVGDVVVRPAYRADVQRRLCTTLKAEHVQLVTSEAEAAACSIEDVFIPFLRGRYPNRLFAPSETQHPIMTREAMLAVLREHHATQLLDGLSETSRVLLDIRSALSPLLFRRLLISPLEMDYVVLEDKAPLRATHFDAARLLGNDRWRWAHRYEGESRAGAGKGGSLIAQSEVLEQTSIGANLPSGMLAEEFFKLPSSSSPRAATGGEDESTTLPIAQHTGSHSDEYLVLGHATRYASGQPLVPATPHTAPAERGDRVYSVYLRAIVAGGATGLTQILREYFTLHGVLDEQDAVLQHKVHRLRREMDAETARLTAPVYCTACYNRDHGRLDGCAEFLFKRSRRLSQLLSDQARSDTLATAIASQKREDEKDAKEVEPSTAPSTRVLGEDTRQTLHATPQLPPSATAPTPSLFMQWRLRRRNAEQPWGVMVKKDLRLVGIRDMGNVTDCTIWPSPHTMEGTNSKELSVTDAWLHAWMQRLQPLSAAAGGEEVAAYVCRLLARLVSQATTPESESAASPQDGAGGSGHYDACKVSQDVMRDHFLASPDASNSNNNSSSVALPGVQYWRLVAVNETAVGNAAEFAAAMLRQRQSRELSFCFALSLQPQPSTITAQEQQPVQTAAQDAQLVQKPAQVPTTTVLKLTPKQAATLVRQATTPQQHWLRELPDTVQLVLAKEVTTTGATSTTGSSEPAPRISWGLHVTEDQLTLSNFAQLLRRYADGTRRADETQVLSFTPAEAFQPLREGVQAISDAHLTRSAARRYTDYVAALDELAEVLNRFYVVTRLYGRRVQTIEEVIGALHGGTAAAAAEEEKRTTQLTSSTGSVAVCHLPVTLQRSRMAHALLAALPRPARSSQSDGQAAAACAGDGNDTHVQQKPQQDGASELAIRNNNSSNKIAAGSQSKARGVSDELRCSPVAMRLLTPPEQTQSTVKVVINRLVQNTQTARRWGVRVRGGTCILRGLQHNRLFAFEVIAARRKQVVRITDALRFFPSSSETASSPAVQPRYYTNYLYVIVSVNDRAVQSYDVLAAAMRSATAVLSAESIVLHVRQYRLAQIAVTVRRGGVGEASALSPVGLQVTPDMCIHAVRPGGPMAIAIEAATAPCCSLRECIRSLTQTPSEEEEGESNSRSTRMHTMQRGREETALVRVPVLQRALADCLATLHTTQTVHSVREKDGVAVDEAGRRRRGRRRKTWAYEFDEDHDEAGTLSDVRGEKEEEARHGAGDVGSQRALRARRIHAALSQLLTVADTVLRELGYCEMVDGVQLLQALYIREFCHRALAVCASATEDVEETRRKEEEEADSRKADTQEQQQQQEQQKQENNDDNRYKELSERVMEQLAAAPGQVRWRVMYAARAKQTLRATADVANVLAAGVAEETIYIQQCAF